MKPGKRYNIDILAEELEYKRKLNKKRRENVQLLLITFFSLSALIITFYLRFI